jgi:hypothetical protein
VDRATKAALLKILTSSGRGGEVRTIELLARYSIVSSPTRSFWSSKKHTALFDPHHCVAEHTELLMPELGLAGIHQCI